MPAASHQSGPSQHRCLDAQRLEQFAQGRLSPREIEAVAVEVEDCPHCQQKLDAIDLERDPLLETLHEAAGATDAADPPELDDLLIAAELAGAESLSQAGSPRTPPDQEADGQSPLRVVGPYRVLQRLGGGGMGTVYVAEHGQLKRRVALKVLSEHRPPDAAARARFQREMEAIGRLDHPHIVRAVDAGEAEGQPYLVMELLEGEDAAKRVRRDGPLPVSVACDIIRQACAAIHFAHRQGLLHRDIKPSNLMLTPSGEVKVLDLGLVRATQAERDADDATLTSASHVLGTGDYVAPEQGLDPRAADERSDVYSLGCTLFFLLAGRPPFADAKGETFTQKVMAHVHEAPPSVRALRSEISQPLSDVVARALAKQPEERFASAEELAQALVPFCQPPAALPSLASSDRAAGSASLRRWTPAYLLLSAGGILAALLLGIFIGASPWLRHSANDSEAPDAPPEAPATDGDTVLAELDQRKIDATSGDHNVDAPPGGPHGRGEKSEEADETASVPPMLLVEPLKLGWIYKEHAGGQRTPTAMLVHGQGFGFLSGVQGKIHGWAERVHVGVGDNDVWGVDGAGVEFGVDIKARAYSVETRENAPQSISVNGFVWSPPSDAVRMLHKDEGICVLTSIQGGLQKAENFLSIELRDDGYYWLTGISNDKRAKVHATGVLLSQSRSLAAEVKQYEWQPGQEPVKMIPADEGLCFLSLLGGSWTTPGDVARVYINEDDGHWYLWGGKADSKAFARALSVRFFGRPQR